MRCKPHNYSLKHDGKMLAHFPRLSFTLELKKGIHSDHKRKGSGKLL
jgi:hypothetical protein